MASEPIRIERTRSGSQGLDRVVTAIALLATVLLILFSPLGG
ncbi:hypothetical protein [Sandaracinobacteroides hominis]|nr:hypothetical protein [Sandaracinobacteroides hominis]